MTATSTLVKRLLAHVWSARVAANGVCDAGAGAAEANALIGERVAGGAPASGAEFELDARCQAVLAELSQRALSGAWLTTLFEEVVAQVSRTLAVSRCEILEVMGRSGGSRLRSTACWTDGVVGLRKEVLPVNSQALYTLASAACVVSDDLRAETRFDTDALIHEEAMVSGVSVVIHGSERRLGVLAAHGRERRSFSRHDVDFLQAVAKLLGAAIERKRSETALRKSERAFREIFERMHDVFYRTGMDGKIQMVSPSIERFGYRGTEVIGQDAPLFDRDEQERRRLVDALLKQSSVTDWEGTMLRKDGTAVAVSKNARLLVDGEGKAVAIEGVLRDITDRKRAQEKIRTLNAELQRRVGELEEAQQKLIHSERVKALGVIAAGIAHELNNPLMGVINQIEYALDRLPKDGRVYEVLWEALAHTRRCIRIVQDLLSQVRKDTGGGVEGGCGSVQNAVRQALRFAEGLLESTKVKVLLSVDDNLPVVGLAESRMQQVIVNLVVNACHAMASSARRELQIDAENGDDAVVLRVRDTGSGMDEATRTRVFEPFYTTKAPGSGTGLGLTLCRNLIESVGGRIEVESGPGLGTSFAINLPHAPDLRRQGGS